MSNEPTVPTPKIDAATEPKKDMVTPQPTVPAQKDAKPVVEPAKVVNK